MLRLRGETLGNLIHQIELQPIDQDKLVTTHLRERFTYTTMAMARGACLVVQRVHPLPIQRWQLCPKELLQGSVTVFLL